MKRCAPLVLVLLLLASEAARADPGIEGTAKYYRAGLMEEVAARRGLSLEGFKGGIALMDAQHLGRTAWLQWPGEAVLDGAYLVVDCAASQHLAARRASGDVVEVGWQTAQERGMRGPVRGVRVWLSGYARLGR